MQNKRILLAKFYTAVAILAVSVSVNAQSQIKSGPDFYDLDQMMSSPNLQVREKTIQEISRLPKDMALVLAEKHFNNDSDPRIKASALKILAFEPNPDFYNKVERILTDKTSSSKSNDILKEAAALSLKNQKNERARHLLTIALNSSASEKVSSAAAEALHHTFGINEVIYYLNNSATFASSFEKGFGVVSPQTKAVLTTVMEKATSHDRAALQDRLRFQVPLNNFIQARNQCVRLFN